MARVTALMIYLAGCQCALSVQYVQAALPPEQKKEIAELKRDLRKATPLLRRKQFDEARAVIEDVESRLPAMGIDAGERNRLLQGLQRSIQQFHAKLPLSFEQSVAPILRDNCFDCHTSRSQGGLRLGTFAAMKRGGQSGALLVRGNPRQSLLIARLITSDPIQRMPKDSPPLSQQEIETIAAWITQGAYFDGKDENARIGSSASQRPAADTPAQKPKIEVSMADGSETVSFMRDIAPWMVNICSGCHGANNPRSGFSVETFEQLMIGGDSGVVVVGGDPDASRIWDLVGKQDPIKMPQGPAVITRTNHRNLRTWIVEGAKFDGASEEDATRKLRDLVPSADEQRGMELAQMSPEQWSRYRLDRARKDWKRVLPRENSQYRETPEYYVLGNVGQPRIEQVGAWAEEYATKLREAFALPSTRTLFRGRLAIFVAKDRFSYEEFNQMLLRRRTPKEMTGHSVVTANQEDAYIVLEDYGDEPSISSGGLRVNLVEQITSAWLKTAGSSLPEWLIRGTGLVMGGQIDPRNRYIRTLKTLAANAAETMDSPDNMFDNGSLTPAEVGPVGFTIVSLLLKSGTPAQFMQFVNRLAGGEELDRVLQSVYRERARSFSNSWLRSLKTAGGAG